MATTVDLFNREVIGHAMAEHSTPCQRNAAL
jgi:hypothetical protein